MPKVFRGFVGKNLHVPQSPIPIYNATCPAIIGTVFLGRDIYKSIH